MKIKVIAVIPARGGSKRVPKKNIKELKGKPLIEWTLDEAYKSKEINEVIISTDDKDVAEFARRGERVVARPEYLATDWARTSDVILDAVKWEDNCIVVCLQPTSPFRTAEDIDGAIRMYKERKCESVISVVEAGRNMCWMMKNRGSYIYPVFGHKYANKRSQDLSRVYIPNGAIYISSKNYLMENQTFYTSWILPYVMPPERSIDIDDLKDFEIAEQLNGKDKEKTA
jgi:CMP-N-acetylneuraminic acid synthetase